MSWPRTVLFGAAAAFVCLVAGSSLSLSAEDQPASAGKELFERRCGGCHALDRDKEGPRLRGVYGRAAGSVRSFQYSDALKKSRITWDAGSLERWLSDPELLVPGTDMSFHLEKADERREIVAYLKQNSGR